MASEFRLLTLRTVINRLSKASQNPDYQDLYLDLGKLAECTISAKELAKQVYGLLDWHEHLLWATNTDSARRMWCLAEAFLRALTPARRQEEVISAWDEIT